MRKTLLLTALLAAAFAAAAADTKPALDLDAADFAQQRGKIQAALGDGETYAEIKPADRQRVSVALDRIQTHLDAAGSVSALSQADRVEVFNDQELVNNVLTQAAADSRLVCRRETPVGSHRAVNRCATVAERRRQAEDAQNALRTQSGSQQGLPTGE